MQLVRVANDGQDANGRTGGEAAVILQNDAAHDAEIFVSGGGLAAKVDAGSGDTTLPGAVSHRAAAIQRLRIREPAGTLVFEYASGATAPGTWSTLARTADPFRLTGVSSTPAAGCDNPTADVARFDNVTTG